MMLSSWRIGPCMLLRQRSLQLAQTAHFPFRGLGSVGAVWTSRQAAKQPRRQFNKISSGSRLSPIQCDFGVDWLNVNASVSLNSLRSCYENGIVSLSEVTSSDSFLEGKSLAYGVFRTLNACSCVLSFFNICLFHEVGIVFSFAWSKWRHQVCLVSISSCV